MQRSIVETALNAARHPGGGRASFRNPRQDLSVPEQAGADPEGIRRRLQ